MTVPLIVQGVTYNYPVTEDIAWGEEATAWAVAMTDAVNIAVVDGDVGPTTQVNIQNTGVFTNVTNLILDGSSVRAALIDYSVYRVKGSTEVIQTGTLRAVYKTNGGFWEMSNLFTGRSDTDFRIQTTGQIQYFASIIGTPGTYTGSMRYRVRVLPI